jgi:hypothetical protein
MNMPRHTPRDLATPLDRITWRDGQLLTARDLRDDERASNHLRHLHIHYLHRTWGVVEGLGVTILFGSIATVAPGYALDVEGHELLLASETAMLAPQNITVATTMYLVISHAAPQQEHCECVETPAIDLATLCPGVQNPVPLIEAALAWKKVNEVRPGHDVLLARVLVANGQFASGADTSLQRHAESLAQPRLWADVTTTGRTGWTDASSGNFDTIQATVDTSDAGFLATPAYFARVTPAAGLLTFFIESASATAFKVVARPIHSRFSAAAAEKAGLVIVWQGIEFGSPGQEEPI